jgi:4-alpha-glucanotransferase
VERFRRDHADEVDFHGYLQFELDRQLAGVAAQARSAGLRIGLYHDLAIGAAPDGSDAWSFPGLFVADASIGAPPDALAENGQNWELPPLHPLQIRQDGYRFWIRLLRGAFAHAGALRIDHVMGLSRQFWIPKGFDGRDGAYVRYPAADLFGVLALESRRSGAIVVGEDLGTVPAGFDELLERWGVLSTRVLYFEREDTGEFRPSHTYSRRAVATVNSHDLAPLAGFAEGRDLVLRRQAGAITSDVDLEEAQAHRKLDCEALLLRLEAEGFWPLADSPTEVDSTSGTGWGSNAGQLGLAELCAAVHMFLGRSPAPLVGVSLDDLAGEMEPVNLPGVKPDVFRGWSRRMRPKLEEICNASAVRQTLAGLGDRAADGGRKEFDSL